MRKPSKTLQWSCLSLALASTFTLSFLPLSAHAKDGDVIRRVICTGQAEIKLKASPENGRIEVEAEIDEAVPGQRWNLVLKSNSSVIFRGDRTVNRFGNIEVRQLTNNGAGPERISAAARNLQTGERCNVAVTFSA